MSAHSLLARVLLALQECGVSSMLTGSFAAAYYSTPRSTHDIDLIIDGTPSAIECVVGKLIATGLYASADAAREAVTKHTLFNVIDSETGWKVDLIIRKDRAFSRTEFERRRGARLLDMEVSVPSIEDLIIAKLEWASLGDSDRQMQDAAQLIRAAGADLDVNYIESWLDALQIRNAWNKAR